ncbi:Serine/threonine-protein kinase smg1 [Thoreauomyces humboldtii]|nr:Serine/threonine-protein kinase smg1 [Thoreauomyces humboldtii]
MDAAEDLLRQLTTPSPAAKGGRGKADLLQTFGQDIDIALADSRSPTSFRNMVVKCVAVLGSENSDPHALVRWSFDRLFNNRPYLRAKDGEKELRMMILALLLEFVEIISSRPSPRNDEVIGRVLTDMQIFVDTMETADYMPKTLDLFQLLAEKYPNQLEKSFKDIVDLLVGWSIDPSLSRNIAALIADTFKKLWRFWMLHVTFSLELARHLLSDIEVLVGLQCGPDAPGSGEVSLSQTSGRTSRLPANAFILVRCLQSVMYVLTYAGFQNMNVDCEIPIGANVEVFESYRETVRWCLQLSAAVGAKYEDRTWLAQGLGFVKFLSKALQAEFSPYQELSLDILMLDCRLFAREYIGEQNYATSVEKEIIDWLAVLEEITDDWLPYLSIAVLPYFTLLTKMIATAQLPTPANEDANPLNQLEELVHEIVDLSCLLVSGEDEDLFCNAIRDPWSENGSYKAHMALVNELEASDQWLILADDIELLTVVTQTDAFSFGVLPLFRILTALTPLVKTSTHWRIVIHERVVLASYTLAERENFFLFGVSIEDLPGVIAMHLHALRFAMDLVDVRYNEGLIVYAWIRDLVLALIEEGDGGTPVASLLDRRTFESLSERTSRMGSMLAKELDPEVRVYMAHAWSAWVDLLLCIEKLGNVHDTRRQVREVLEVARQRIKTQVQELQHLLTFIDLLEVQVRNASDGSLQCAQAPKASIAFFYTNKKSCEEWFARVRKSLIQAARVAGASTMLVKHSLQFLRENVDPRGEPALKERNLVPADTETVLRDLVDELTALQDPDTLTGIGQWLDEIGLTKRDDMDIPAQQITLLKRSAAPASQSDATFCLPWSKAYRLLAEHRFEDALPLLKRSRDALSKMTGTNLERTQPIDGWLQRQIVDSYVQLEDWSALQHWLTETRQSAAVSTLPSYMLGRNATTLSAWQMLDVPQLEEDKGVVFPKVANIAYLLHLGYPTACLRISEASVIQGILGKDVINLVDSDVRGLLRNALACTTGGDTNREHDLILHAGFEPQLLAPFCGDGSPFDDIPKSSCSALNLLLHVCRRQARLSADGDMPAPLRSLQFLVARTARKNRNFAFATRMTERDDAGRTETYEYAKLEYSRGKRRQGIATLLDSLKEDSKQEESPQSAARILVRLARWITTSATDIRLASSLVNDLEAVCSGAEPDTPVQSFPEKTNNLDDLAQHLLLKATVCAPDDAKAWFRYAGHCYKAGRRALDMATVLSGDKYGAQAALRDLVSPLIPKGSSDEGFKVTCFVKSAYYSRASLNTFLLEKQQLLGLIHDELRRPGLTGIDVPDSLFDRSLKKTFPELKLEQALPICAHVQEIKRSILGYLRLAAVSYFRYLQVVGSSSGLPAESQRFAVATLRTADVFLLYPALRDTLVPHFQVTPVGPWEGIVPQLYARMDHPDLLARTTIMTLVRRIGAASPQLTVYSALADTPMTAEATGVPSPTILQALQNDGAAPLVLQVQELLGELKRITVLWEESWLHKLAHVHGDAAKRLERIEGEMNRVRRSPSLSDSEKDRLVREYYHTIMKPLVNLLEKLQVTTSCGPESTPHEKWFEHTYQSRIDGALTALREPDDITNPKNAWEPFKALYADLSHELQRSRELKLADVSPVLANFRGSVIPMPGLLDKFITIDSFTDAFHVLPSKTKPKKLQLMGSDGQKYTYLFKGMEDLHMDERVQQLLRLINQFLDQDKPSRGRHLRARSYAVIPCGQRFGMIQWVEDVTPFFTLFKRWQQRDYSARLLQRQESDKEPVPAPLRPHEQFYGRMGPALKRQGLSSKTPRRDWPQVAMRETLQLLERETPSDLVSRELFCASPSATAWWDKTKAFGRSTAVMSMIGYMIGLGDRHLDNILLDQHSGELVHIDFNVCFENGFKLRVPETVPFRLTQNIRSALGVTGTHGVFRIASENVLRVMRDNRETLLTLLEAFVYDPLVDWTRNASEDVDKRRLELNVNIGVLASRVAEKRDAIESTIQDMLKACDEVHRLLAENFPCSPLRKASFVDPTLPRPQQVGEARDLIARRRSECEMWATRHSRALLSLQGPVLQACASEACSPETVGCFPPIAPATFMMGPSEWQMARCVEFDQELFRIGKQKVLCYQRCLEHLQLYQSIAAPIAEQLLQQDRFVLWPTLLNSLLGPPGLDPSADAFAKVFGGPTEENLTEHTRKAALEAVMKSICSFKDEELEAARQSLEGKSSSPSQLDTDIELTSALADPERGQMLAQCISLQHLAQVGHLLYVAIKDPAQIATIEGDLASVIRASTAELTSLYRTKRAYQPLLYETKAMVSVAMVSAVLLQVDSTDVNGLPVTNIKNYGDLSSNLCSIHWHLTEVLLPEVMQILATNHPSTMQALLSELEVITKPFADGNLDQTSSNFQDAATKLSREFKSLCSKWASRTHKAVHSVLSTCDMMFAPVLAGVESVSQSDSADFKIIQNVLVVYQVLFIVEIVAACQSYIPGSEMDVDDPTNEWTAVFDFNDIVLEHEAFSKAIVTLRKFVDVCLREVIMKPLAKLVAKTIKRCAGGGKVEAATELQSPTGIPFVDAAWSALDCKLKSVPEHTAWYELGLNSAVLRRDAMLADAERLEGMAILSRYHARAHRRRLALSRYQLLHEAALTYPSRRAGAFLSPTPRLRFIGSIGDDLPVLMQLSNDMVNLDRNYMILTEELEPLLQACSDAPAVETFRELRAVRFQQIKIEIGRVTSMIELCNTLVHFETFRVPSPSTNALDEDILNSVRGLQLVIEGPSDSLPIKMSANVARTIADKIDALSAIYDDTGKILQDIHQVVEALVFTSQNLAVARGLREDLQEHLRRWSGIGALVQMHRLTVERLSDNSLDPNDVPALRSTLLELQSKAEHLLKSTCAFASLSELDHGSADRDVPVDHAALASPMQASLRPETPRAEPLAFSSEALYVDDENEQTLLVAMDAKQSSGIVPDNFGFMEPARTPDDIVILRQSDANASELSLEDGHATGQQERNAYGLGVLRRIKDKLDGKDNAERRKMSVSEQVDKVTQEALDPKRIAAMYEGWMAWI